VAQKGKDSLEKQFELMQTEIEELTEKLALVGKHFSNISSLLNLPYQRSVELTFEKLPKETILTRSYSSYVQKFSNVSSLLNLRYKRAIVLTFEKFPKESRSL